MGKWYKERGLRVEQMLYVIPTGTGEQEVFKRFLQDGVLTKIYALELYVFRASRLV